jgi:hypothetical protein
MGSLVWVVGVGWLLLDQKLSLGDFFTKNGQLTDRFKYLEDFVAGRE